MKKDLSERDICTQFITPALQESGWDFATQVREEVTFTAGRIIVRGKLHSRGTRKRADYLLYYKPNLPIAVIEAKDNTHGIGDGMQQALGYADTLDLPFVFSSNGDGFLFHDRTGHSPRPAAHPARHGDRDGQDLQNAGNAGEYYTPRPVTQFMVDMVAPQLGEKILDPACGTGGFLTCAIETVRKHQVRTVEQEQVLQQSIHGVEKKPLPHLLCTTNMILHGIDVPTNVRHDNTLARPLRDYGPKDRVDVIVTNPPFGGMEEDGIEANFPANFRTRETADLFLVLIMHLLKDGGRAAVVLPDGTLFGEGIKTRIKEQLLTTCNLHTVVRLPNGVFSPYTGIKTNLLFFTKGTPTENVWFYEPPYPPGVKNYNKTKPMRLEEFAAEKAWWNERTETEYAWKVSADDIKARNYNLDVKNPHSPDLVSHDPAELLADYAALQARIAETRAKLKSVLAAALQGEN